MLHTPWSKEAEFFCYHRLSIGTGTVGTLLVCWFGDLASVLQAAGSLKQLFAGKMF
jgi:hypothetical protein